MTHQNNYIIFTKYNEIEYRLIYSISTLDEYVLSTLLRTKKNYVEKKIWNALDITDVWFFYIPNKQTLFINTKFTTPVSFQLDDKT